MKTNFSFISLAKIRSAIKMFSALAILLFIISCQKNEPWIKDYDNLKDPDMIVLQDLSSDCSFRDMALYYGHEKFRRSYGAPVTETRIISNPDFSCFGDLFILKIRSGMDKRTRVASGDVWIDGKLIVRQSDFNKHTYLIVKHISGLKPESKLEVKLNGTPGSYIDLWIEGIMNKVTPVFDQIGPLCQNSEPPLLPGGSLNDPPVAGSWSPGVISTSIVGNTTYTFTPAEGQCGEVVKMEIEVLPSVVPAFEQIGPFAQGSVPPALPLVSTNGISGTWKPDKINTSAPGEFRYTFTPDPGQCATPAERVITITQSSETISDIDGNVYKIVKIGDQWWMAENLKTTKYNNGDVIGTTVPATLDLSLELTPKYQWAYGGDEINVSAYGRLYTWYTVTDNRGVCPVGWHVPTNTECTILTDYLTNNGYGYGGSGNDIAKSLASKSNWGTDATPGNVGNDQVSNNSSGLTILPSGIRYPSGLFTGIGFYSAFWSSSESNLTNAWLRSLYSNNSSVVEGNANRLNGVSIRCVKDN